jgi:hypothetical protein
LFQSEPAKVSGEMKLACDLLPSLAIMSESGKLFKHFENVLRIA